MNKHFAGLSALLFLGAAQPALAQDAIERIKLGDNQLTCRQMHEEIGSMDKIMADASGTKSTSETAGTVAGVAAAATPGVAQAAALAGGVNLGPVGGLLGGVANLFGGAARAVAQNQANKADTRLEGAKGRKEHLTQLFNTAGCNVTDLDAPPAKPMQVAMAETSAATKAAAAPLSAADIPAMVEKAAANISPVAAADALEGKVPEMLGKAPKIAVAGFRVAFVTSAAASASAQAGLANIGQTNRITQSQSASIEISLANVDPALMQAIADKAYADFMDRLARTGREIVPLEEVMSSEAWKELEVSKLDPGKHYAKDNQVIVSPKQIPLWFFHSEPYGDSGMLALGNWKAMSRLSVDKNTVVLVPMLTINFARTTSSGRSMLGSSAEVTAEAGMSLAQNSTFVWGFHAERPSGGDVQRTFFKRGVPLPGDFGVTREVTSTDTSGLANALTMFTGLQGNQRRSKKLAVQADPSRYAEKALTGAFTANAAFTDALKKQ